MNQFTKSDVHLCCRICLCTLNPALENIQSLKLDTNLAKLLLIFTTIDVDDDNDSYPKNICQLCNDVLQDFQSFRSFALRSNRELCNILCKENLCKSRNDVRDTEPENLIKVKRKPEEIDDDVFIIPDLSTQVCKPLKKIESKNLEETQEEKQNITLNENSVDDPLLLYSSDTETPEMHEEEAYTKIEVEYLPQQCKTKFCPERYLTVHMNEESDEYICEECGVAKDSLSELQKHIDRHKFAKLKKIGPKIAIQRQNLRATRYCTRIAKTRHKRIKIGEKPFCKLCKKTFSALKGFKIHMKRHANIKEHVCKVCGVAKVTVTELHTHMRIHEPKAEKFKCSICPQEFNHKNAIQRHIRAVHEGRRPYPCSYCPKRFGTRNSKICHERLHTGERPFVCDICNKGFAQSEGLKSHMKTHDKSLRTHVCKYCSQRFITRRNLINHEARHQGDKPHICDICSRGFFKREEMVLHRSSHADDIDDGEEAENTDSISQSSD